MQIRDVIPVVGRSGFFNRDLAAVKAGARADGLPCVYRLCHPNVVPMETAEPSD